MYCTFADFLQKWNFPLHNINFAERNSKAAMGRAQYRVQCSSEGCDRWVEGRGILYFEASVVQWREKRPWRPQYGTEGKHFVSGLFFYFGGCSEAALGGGARSAPFGMAMRPKRRVRAAHARPKPTSTVYMYTLQRVMNNFYRGPGFLAVVLFGSSPSPSPLRHAVSSTGDTQDDWAKKETTCWRDRGGVVGGWGA